MRREFPRIPNREGSAGAAGGFPSPARGHGGTPARRGEHPLTALLGLIRFQELPKIAAARRWNGRREEV